MNIAYILSHATCITIASLIMTPNFVAARRRPKFFSLVNIVRFSNGECVSSDAGRSGTCLSGSECLHDGGAAFGTCAAGFGVCCLFSLSTCGSTVSRNCSYVQNAGFPAAHSGPDQCDFFVQKCSPDICFLRLDFDSFALQGPVDPTEADGGACAVDAFSVGGGIQAAPLVPIICGENSGQHIYVELTPGDAGEVAALQFRLSPDAVAAVRRWQVKVTQVECDSTSRPPSGCLQYLTSPSGRLTTFNFAGDAATGMHLANQRYSICIAQREGFCCVEYSLCAGVAGAFAINNVDAAGAAAVDNNCVEDYIGIEASSNICNRGPTSAEFFVSKYCGRTLSAVAGSLVDSPICDCSEPYLLDVVTDGGAAVAQAATRDRGVCLDYNLVPCL